MLLLKEMSRRKNTKRKSSAQADSEAQQLPPDEPDESVELPPEVVLKPQRKRRGRFPRVVIDPNYKDPDIFNPKLFKGGSGYDGIVDSSDSESEEGEYVPKATSAQSIELDDEGLDPTFNTENYFELDKGPLITSLLRKLQSKFPGADDGVLRSAIKSALKKTNDGLVDEYCSAVPKDESWKVDIPEEQVEALEVQLKELRQNIKDRVPTIPKILQSRLATAEKERALQFYDAMKNTEPYTLAFIEMNQKLADIINSAPVEVTEDVDVRLKGLREKITEEAPSVEKIVAARLTRKDKMRTLQLYDCLQQHGFGTADSLDMRARIKLLLDSQFASDQELARAEAEEEKLQKSTNYFEELKHKIVLLEVPVSVKNKLYEMYRDMISRGHDDSHHSALKAKLMWCLRLPYGKLSVVLPAEPTPEFNRALCGQAYRTLNTEMYGLSKIKSRIVEALNKRLCNPGSRTLLAFKGKPGVGKTKLAKTIAKAVGRPFEKISLGGAIDPNMFRGSDSVWIGSAPSLLLQLMSKSKASDPVILLDEIDKLASSNKGIEVQNSLLHVLDPIQSKEFQDSYLNEFNHDISNVWFILALNDESKMDPALKDRLDIIELEPYTHQEMIEIVKRHTLPDALADNGMKAGDVTITNRGAAAILTRLSDQINETGMRPVERAVYGIADRLNMLRTMWTGAGVSDEFPLDFEPPEDFKGFPYELTEESVRCLFVPPKNTAPTYFT